MKEAIILCVDDDVTVLSALRILLAKQLGAGHLIEIAESGEEALEIAEEMREQGREIGVIISDFIMPEMRGDELLVRMHERSPRTVKIMLTGQSDLRGIQRATNEANLYKFIEKPFSNDEIVSLTRSAIDVYRHDWALTDGALLLRDANADLVRQAENFALELSRAEQALMRLADTDPLTGLYRHSKFTALLHEAVANAGSGRAAACSLMVIHLDHLADINDRVGYQGGDQAIATVATLAGDVAGGHYQVGRGEGPRLLMLSETRNVQQAQSDGQRLVQTVRDRATEVGGVSVRAGVAGWQVGDTADTLLARAIAALQASIA